MSGRLRSLLFALLLFPPAGECAAASALQWDSWSWTQHLLKPGQDRQLVVGARVAGDLRGPAGIHLVGRIDASALGDGAQVSIEDPKSFSTLELYGGLWRDVAGPFAVAAVYGAALPIEGGSVAAVERYPKTLGVGVLAGNGTGETWALVMLGRHDAAGAGLRVLATGQVLLLGRTSAVADAALGGRGSFVRAGVAVRLR